jgi:LCP family protein required for cell wall assembly
VKRSTGKWLAGGAAAVVLAGAAAFVWLNRGEEGLPLIPPGSSAPTPTPSPTFNQELLNRRWTVLLIGLDTNEPRRARGAGLNTDTLMLASVSADQSELALISLPRDTVDVPLPDGGTWTQKINGLYLAQGVDTLVGAMQELFQVPIHAYVQIDMDDLVTLVDAAGGVDVDPEEPLRDRPLHLRIQPGPQELDGLTAMRYVRTRVDTDYGRMARQQEVLLDLVSRLLAPEADTDWEALLSSLNTFETDLPLDELPTLLEVGRRALDADVTRQVIDREFITFEGIADERGYILVPDIEAIRAAVDRIFGRGG